MDKVVVVETRFPNIYIERPNLTSYEEVMIYRSFGLAVSSLLYSIWDRAVFSRSNLNENRRSHCWYRNEKKLGENGRQTKKLWIYNESFCRGLLKIINKNKVKISRRSLNESRRAWSHLSVDIKNVENGVRMKKLWISEVY